jgi:hypothetical protein
MVSALSPAPINSGVSLFRETFANGVTIIKPITATGWGTKGFYVEDPDGYIIGFGATGSRLNRLHIVRVRNTLRRLYTLGYRKSIATLCGMWIGRRISGLLVTLKETEHFCRWRQNQVAKIVSGVLIWIFSVQPLCSL